MTSGGNFSLLILFRTHFFVDVPVSSWDKKTKLTPDAETNNKREKEKTLNKDEPGLIEY